jgi:CRP/FNR family transcriptional regulator
MPAQNTAKVFLANLKTACASCSLRELCLPFGLDPLDLQKLDAIINRRRRMRMHEHLYRAGDTFQSLYAIRSGFFKTYELNRDGHEQISGFHMPGELIGLDAISSEKHVCGAVALDESEICEIPFYRLEELFRDVPTLQHRFHKLMSREISEDHHQMMVLGTMRAEQRLAAFLLSLSDRLKARGYSPTSIHLSMSREEIGNYLGLKLETVSRMFSKFQEDGLIHVERRNLVIQDREKLLRLTE